jgi:hypothetical protein
MAEAWTLTYPARPWTVNDERKRHWSDRATKTKEWREAFGWLARKARIPRLPRVFVSVQVECRTAKSMPDPGACYPAVKAAVDGLVDAGVIAGDRAEQVAGLLLWAPVVTGRDAVTLTVHVRSPAV